MSLSSLIVQRDVATMRQVEEALARQVIYGGDLVTNLLEVARLDEAVLTPLLAESMHLAPAPFGELPPPSDPVRALVPAEVAVQRAVVPVDVRGETLLLAVVEPLPADVREQMAFALGMRVEQLAAPAARVWQGIARTYGVALDRRMARLIGRMSGDPTAFSVPPVAPSLAPASPPPRTRTSRPPPELAPGSPAPPPVQAVRTVGAATSLSPRAGRRSTLTAFPSTRGSAASRSLAPAGEPAVVQAGVDTQGLVRGDPQAGLRPGRRRRGPLTIEDARDEAEEAADRDGLLDLFFDFSLQFFDYTALFLVQADIAEGRDAFGSGASRERVLGIGVPLDLPSLLASAREKRVPVIAKGAADGLDAVLVADLQRPRGTEIVVAPLVVRTRAVALLLGDCGDAGIDRDGVHQVAVFAGVVGKAFERIIVRRKLEGFVAGSRSGGEGRAVADRVPVKHPLSESPLPLPPTVQFPAATGGSNVAEPAKRPEPAHEAAPAPPAAALPPPAMPAEPSVRITPRHSSGPPPPEVNIATLRKISGPPIPREEPDSRPAMPALRIETPDALAVVEAAARNAPTLEVSETIDEDHPTALYDTFARELVESESGSAGGRAVAAPSSSFAVSAHRPPPSKTAVDRVLPLVIVDFDGELGAVVDRLIAAGEDEATEAELIRQGERAMPAIMARFPGPVGFERARIATMPAPPRPSDCGVLLRLVARQRRVALPFVLERLVDPDPERRGWATHLLLEMPYVEALPRLLERLRDQDAATRTSAAHAVAAIAKSHPGLVTQPLIDLAEHGDLHEQLAAMRAMGEVREASFVPVLVHGLGDGSEATVSAAHAALVQVTRQDFGADARPWLKWWEHNSGRHRLEWLIDALTHDVSELRRLAGEELRALSRQYFGYASDLPPRDRERAQRRYRDWWITEGRARQRP